MTYGQTWIILPFGVILDLKLSVRETSQSRILESIEDLAANQKYPYKPVINIILEWVRPWYEVQLSEKQHGFRKNCGTTDGVQYIQWREFTK